MILLRGCIWIYREGAPASWQDEPNNVIIQFMDQAITRFTIFVITLAVMGLWEALSPRRSLRESRLSRWPSNLSVVAIGNILVFLIPFVPVSAALLAVDRGWGLLHVVQLPQPVAFIAAVLLLDLVIYLQHLVFHKVDILWRLHLMHHIDSDVDVSTALRFHPAEILLSLALKVLAVLAFGAPPMAVLVFEALLSSSAMFNHGNVYIPARIDGVLRSFLITPDMHRIHHSVKFKETNSNYGFFLSFWDRLFRTYTRHPAKGHLAMRIGVPGYGSPKYRRLGHMLIVPFQSPVSGGKSRDGAVNTGDRRPNQD